METDLGSYMKDWGLTVMEIWDFLELAAIATVGDVMDLAGREQDHCKGMD